MYLLQGNIYFYELLKYVTLVSFSTWLHKSIYQNTYKQNLVKNYYESYQYASIEIFLN